MVKRPRLAMFAGKVDAGESSLLDSIRKFGSLWPHELAPSVVEQVVNIKLGIRRFVGGLNADHGPGA